jgi:hypothetical protein
LLFFSSSAALVQSNMQASDDVLRKLHQQLMCVCLLLPLLLLLLLSRMRRHLQGWRHRSMSRSHSPSIPPLPPGAPLIEGGEAAAATGMQQQQQQREDELPYLQMATLMFKEGQLPSGCNFNSTLGMYQLKGSR